MQHIVERLIDGLPVYLKEDYPKFVALIRAYYTWQAQDGKFLAGVYGHEALLDVDRDGLTRIIEEMDESDVPEQHRRSFVMFAREFNSSRGSLASFTNFFRIFFDAPVRVSNSSRYVFMPSSAVRERYQRAVVTTTATLPATGVLRQSFGGGVADVVGANCLAVRGPERTYELIVVVRNDKFFRGSAFVAYGEQIFTVTFLPYIDFASTDGSAYQVGDAVTVSTELMTFIGEVTALEPIQVDSVTIDAAGAGYKIGNVITIPGARGFRAEVSEIDSGGGITEVRVIDRGDPFGGVPEFFIASTGSGAQLSYAGISGRPRTLKFDMHPFAPMGLAGFDATVEITSDSGVDAAFATTPRLFQDVWIPRGYNGVIGVGTTLTDSAAYQDASYIVSTPVDAHKWVTKVKGLLHPVGRYMHAVKTAGGETDLPQITGADSVLMPYEYLSMDLATGVSSVLEELDVTLPPIDLSILFDNGSSVELMSLFKPPAELQVTANEGSAAGARVQTSQLFTIPMADGQTGGSTLT